MPLGRRDVVLGGLALGGGLAIGPAAGFAVEAATLPPWTPGTLDIHHIDTGVGNATFILAPDGTTILIDCGATRGGPPVLDPASQAVNARFLPKVKSTEGHVVVRVRPEGDYRIFVTDSRDESDRVTFAGQVREPNGHLT